MIYRWGVVLAVGVRATELMEVASQLGGVNERESLLEILSAVDQTAALNHRTASMDRRRFWGNNKNACEAGGDPDTANGDCHERRWKALLDYYPIHRAVSRQDRNMVLGEYAVEGILERTLNNIEKDAQVLVGSNGALEKPSASEGLIAEAKLLQDASSQLERASIASVAVLFDSVMNLTEVADESVKRMKTNVAAAYSDLTGKITEASQKQGQRADENSKIMINDANRAFSSSVASVESAQVAASKALQQTAATNEKNAEQFGFSVGSVSAKLSDAEELVDSTDESLKKQTEVTAEQLADRIGDSAQTLADRSQEKIDQVRSNVEGIQSSLEEKTSAQIQESKKDWADAAVTAADKAKGLAEKTTERIEGTGEQITSMVTNASSTASSLISETQEEIKERTNDALAMNKDAAGTASRLSSNVNEKVTDVAEQKNQAVSSAESSAGSAKQEVSELMKSASAGAEESVQSVLESMGEVQADAQAQRSHTEAQSQAAIAGYLESVGEDGAKVAGALSGLQNTIATGQSKTGAEIEAQFRQTEGQTEATEAGLTGKLDQVGSTLTDAEIEFQNSSSAANRDLNDKLKYGVSLTVAQMDQLAASDAELHAKLLNSILDGSGEFIVDAETLEKITRNLKNAIGGLDGQTAAAAQALRASGALADSAVEDLFGSVGDSDEEAIEKIRKETEAQREAMNMFGSTFSQEQSSKMAALWMQVLEALKQQERAADRNTDKAEIAEKQNLEKANRVEEIASGLQGNVDSLVADGSNKADASRSEFDAKLKAQSAKDDNAITALQGLLKQYEGDAMSDIGYYLQSLINAQFVNINSGLEQQKSSVSSMQEEANAATAEATKLAALIDAIRKISKQNRQGVIGQILRILASTEDGTNVFGEKIKKVSSQLGEARTKSAEGIAKLTRSIQAEVLKIPQTLTVGASRLQNSFEMASSDLDNNILKLREKMALAKTEEERKEAMQGLVVLNKLQAIQQGVQEADRKLRAQIKAGATGSQIDAGNIQGAMASILGAMTTINSEMDTSRLTVETNTEAFGKQTATLVNGLNLMVNSTADRLADEAAQAAVDARFNLNMAQARNKVRLAAATKGVNGTLSVFSRNSDTLAEEAGKTRGNIGAIKSTTAESSRALSARIEDVLSQVMSSAALVESNASEGQSDVLTRLALVRMAMSKFITLWNEYASTTDRKLNRFHSADAEFISQMEADLKSKLGGSEAAVNQTSAKIAELKTQIQLSMKDQVEYENFFNVKMQELKNSLKRLNEARSGRTLEASSLVNDFENFVADNLAALKENVKRLIDQFDDSVSGHVTDMDQFNQVTSSSLLEKEIHELDAMVADLVQE